MDEPTMSTHYGSVNSFDGTNSTKLNCPLGLARALFTRAPGLEDPSVAGGRIFLDSKYLRAVSLASRSGRVVFGTTAASTPMAS